MLRRQRRMPLANRIQEGIQGYRRDTDITAILGVTHTKYCCDTCLYTLKKPEGRNVCIKHGPVSSLVFTPFFIQPIYIYIYIYINIENRKKLHFHPDKPVS